MHKDSKYNLLITKLLDHLKKSEGNITAIMVAEGLGISVKDLYNVRAGTKKGTQALFLAIANEFPEEYSIFEQLPKEDSTDIQMQHQNMVNELIMQLKYLRGENERLKKENDNVRSQLLEIAEMIEKAFPGDE
ncbi:MAG: hypothetical protein AAFZ15_33245, partial [Bacteroidota bacterium]